MTYAHDRTRLVDVRFAVAFDLAPVDVHVGGHRTISKGKVWWRDRTLYAAKRIKGGVNVTVVATDVDEPTATKHKWYAAGDVELYACGCGSSMWRKYTTGQLEAMLPATNGHG